MRKWKDIQQSEALKILFKSGTSYLRFRMECGLIGVEPLSSDDFRHNRFSLTVRKRKPTAPSKDYNQLLCWAKHMRQLIENRG